MPGREDAVRPATKIVNQPPDRDPPDPGCDLATAVVAGRLPPDRDEGVLDSVVDDVRISAPPGEPQGEPGSVAVAKEAQRLTIAVRHRREQFRVLRSRRSVCTHVSPVASGVKN